MKHCRIIKVQFYNLLHKSNNILLSMYEILMYYHNLLKIYCYVIKEHNTWFFYKLISIQIYLYLRMAN